MVTILELKGWVDAVAKNMPDSLAGIDDGGLTVRAISSTNDAYYEIGGIPEEPDGDEHWKSDGFVYEAMFTGEYELWINPATLQKLRRYCDGSEWLSDLKTGEYVKVKGPDGDDEEEADS